MDQTERWRRNVHYYDNGGVVTDPQKARVLEIARFLEQMAKADALFNAKDLRKVARDLRAAVKENR